MKVVNDLYKISEDKYYFYEMFREYVIEFDTENEVKKWIKDQEEKDEYFGYDGYWLKNGKESREHFKLDKPMEQITKDSINKVSLGQCSIFIGDVEIKPVNASFSVEVEL